jgi:hypothetical protein
VISITQRQDHRIGKARGVRYLPQARRGAVMC